MEPGVRIQCDDTLQVEREVASLTRAVARMGGPYEAPGELVDRLLDAAVRLWSSRGQHRAK